MALSRKSSAHLRTRVFKQYFWVVYYYYYQAYTNIVTGLVCPRMLRQYLSTLYFTSVLGNNVVYLGSISVSGRQAIDIKSGLLMSFFCLILSGLPHSGEQRVNMRLRALVAHLVEPGGCVRLDLLLDPTGKELGLLHKFIFK